MQRSFRIYYQAIFVSSLLQIQVGAYLITEITPITGNKDVIRLGQVTVTPLVRQNVCHQCSGDATDIAFKNILQFNSIGTNEKLIVSRYEHTDLLPIACPLHGVAATLFFPNSDRSFRSEQVYHSSLAFYKGDALSARFFGWISLRFGHILFQGIAFDIVKKCLCFIVCRPAAIEQMVSYV